ncbi:hypothetical protein C8R47DRAFT_1071933 [Mycena vitilis]|nr:hypothetical protein C8R47DRAFT_1071933 [Mycena vitilis]
MANLTTPSTTASRSDLDLDALVELVGRLAVAANEATRMAQEVQAKLPLALERHAASSTTWIRGVPKTPADLDRAFPDGSGETCEEANALTDGVPHQFRRKKTSRREALDFYREHYAAAATYDNIVAAATADGAQPPPGINMGVQKWIGLPARAAVPFVAAATAPYTKESYPADKGRLDTSYRRASNSFSNKFGSGPSGSGLGLFDTGVGSRNF